MAVEATDKSWRRKNLGSYLFASDSTHDISTPRKRVRTRGLGSFDTVSIVGPETVLLDNRLRVSDVLAAAKGKGLPASLELHGQQINDAGIVVRRGPLGIGGITKIGFKP